MRNTKYEVELTPHYFFFGLPSEPTISIKIYKIETKFGWPISNTIVLNESFRDLFVCVSKCNKYFSKNNIKPEQVKWPEFCHFITDYKE